MFECYRLVWHHAQGDHYIQSQNVFEENYKKKKLMEKKKKKEKRHPH